jgi:hypothetical protein
LLVSFGPTLEERTAPQRRHRREVERLAQSGVADLREPLGELGEAGLVVGKDAVAQAPALTHEAGVELQLGDIESERRE